MGFFENIILKLTGRDENSRMRKVNKELNELRLLKQNLDGQLDHLRSLANPDKSKFILSKIDDIKIDIAIFSPRSLGHHVTMADLYERRLEAEKERIRQLRIEVERMFSLAQDLLREDDVEGAEETLYQASPLIKEIKDETLSSNYEDMLSDIADLKERMRIREIERLKAEEERLAQQELQRQENIRLQQELEEQIRIERERQAREYEENLANEEQIIQEERERLTILVSQPKVNPQRYLNFLRMNHVECFYHFTDEMNLNSIRRYGGLYSWFYCERHNIQIPNAGGDAQSRNLDRRYALEDYVKLSFCSDHPMAYRKHQEGAGLVLLKIKIDVAGFKETAFSDMNATDSDHTHGTKYEDLERINVAATKASHVSRDHPYFHMHQAECMVKTFIPIEYIVNIDNPQRMVF